MMEGIWKGWIRNNREEEKEDLLETIRIRSMNTILLENGYSFTDVEATLDCFFINFTQDGWRDTAKRGLNF